MQMEPTLPRRYNSQHKVVCRIVLLTDLPNFKYERSKAKVNEAEMPTRIGCQVFISKVRITPNANIAIFEKANNAVFECIKLDKEERSCFPCHVSRETKSIRVLG